jgi:hypothetical protein
VLHAAPSIGQDEKGSHIEVLDTVANLGPIQDFCVVDLERQGQGQVGTRRRATRNMNHAACDMQHESCNMQHTTSNMNHATCNIRDAT